MGDIESETDKNGYIESKITVIDKDRTHTGVVGPDNRHVDIVLIPEKVRSSADTEEITDPENRFGSKPP
jgi:hypothetical protein